MEMFEYAQKKDSVYYRNHIRGIGAYQLCAVLFSAGRERGIAVVRLPVQFCRFFALLHWEPQKLIRIGKLVHDIFLFRRGCPIIWHLCPPLLPQAVTMDAFCARHSSPRHRERVPDLNSYFAVSVRQICCVRSHLYPHFSATRADSFEMANP